MLPVETEARDSWLAHQHANLSFGEFIKPLFFQRIFVRTANFNRVRNRGSQLVSLIVRVAPNDPRAGWVIRNDFCNRRRAIASRLSHLFVNTSRVDGIVPPERIAGPVRNVNGYRAIDQFESRQLKAVVRITKIARLADTRGPRRHPTPKVRLPVSL